MQCGAGAKRGNERLNEELLSGNSRAEIRVSGASSGRDSSRPERSLQIIQRFMRVIWSGRGDSNPRLQPWQSLQLIAHSCTSPRAGRCTNAQDSLENLATPRRFERSVERPASVCGERWSCRKSPNLAPGGSNEPRRTSFSSANLLDLLVGVRGFEPPAPSSRS